MEYKSTTRTRPALPSNERQMESQVRLCVDCEHERFDELDLLLTWFLYQVSIGSKKENK